MNMPPIVSPQEWIAAREKLLVKEKEHIRAGDALAAERRRMPRVAVEKDDAFEGPDAPQADIERWRTRMGWEIPRFTITDDFDAEYLHLTALGRQEGWEDSSEGYPQTAPYQWWNLHDESEGAA